MVEKFKDTVDKIKAVSFVPSVTPEAWIYGYDILPLDR